MSDTPSYTEVRNALQENLNSVETEYSELAGALRATISEGEEGQFYRTLRVNGFEFDSSRFGDTIVAHIEAEEQSSLATLFG